MRPRSIAVVIASVPTLFGLGAASVFLTDRADNPAPPEYTVAEVTRGDVVRAVGAVGQLSPLVSVEVSSQISGLVTDVTVDFNSSVKKGQLLARIDSSTFKQQLRQRQADVEAARANYSLVEINARRLKALYEQDIVSQQEYDQVQAQLQQSRSILLASEAAIQNVRVDLERCEITSPIDGLVIFRQIEVGKTVVSSLNAPTLFVISPDLSKMKIVAPINEVDVAEIRVGQNVTFTVDAVPNREFRGILTQIRSPYTPQEKQVSNPQRSVAFFDAVVELENQALFLRPGLTASISIIIEKRSNVLRIPNGAMRVVLPNTSRSEHRTDGTAVIYRIQGGRGHYRPEPVLIRIGTADAFVTEVLSGIGLGDMVVTGVLPPAPAARRGLLAF